MTCSDFYSYQGLNEMTCTHIKDYSYQGLNEMMCSDFFSGSEIWVYYLAYLVATGSFENSCEESPE